MAITDNDSGVAVGMGSVGKVQGTTECRDPEFQGQKIKNNFPVMVVETFDRVADFGL